MVRSLARPALVIFAALTLITGFIYPLLIAGVAKVAFADKAGGSLVERDGKPIGSSLIGQNFADSKYFWSRPSATAPQPYNGTASAGSNQGPLNPALVDAVKARTEALRAADPENKALIPVDLVTASASGLDPHISVAAANYQVARIARVRGLDREKVQALVNQHAELRALGFLGEPRVNVLRLNLDLDRLPKG